MVLAAAACATAVFAACGPGSAPAKTAAAAPVKTNVGKTKTTMSLFTGAGTQSFNQGLATAFEAKYPAITVKLDVVPDNDYNTVLPRLLDTSNPPDVAAPADLITDAKDGLLTNLDQYAAAYKWTSKIPSSVLAQGRVSTSGVIGSGPLYTAGGSAGPLVGIFYNKALAAKVGITSAPQTVAALQSDLAKAKQDGITPIIASNEDGLIGHLYSLLLGDYMGPAGLNALVNNDPGAKLNTPAAVKATATLASWMKDGYFNSDANSIEQETSYGEFAAGKGLFMFQGSWMTQSLPTSFAGKYGVLPFPPVAAGGKYSAMLSNSLMFAISANSKHKNSAALFLNFLTTPAAAAVAVKNGYAALDGSEASATSPSLDASFSQQIQDGYGLIAKDDGFTNWLQNSAGPVNTAETQQLQLLFAGKTTPAAMVASLQSTYASAIAANS